MKLDALSPEVLLITPTPRKKPAIFMAHSSGFRTAQGTVADLAKRDELPAITLVETGPWRSSVSGPLKKLVSAVAEKMNESQIPEKKDRSVVFWFDLETPPIKADATWCRNLFKAFRDPTKVQVAFGTQEMELTVNQLLAKSQLMFERTQPLSKRNGPAASKEESQERPTEAFVPAPPRKSALDDVRELVEATGDLREKNGNLSAKKVADLFSLSLGELAGWFGRTRQALAKTPAADGLQPGLGYLERVARLRGLLPDNGAFRKWLRISNPSLEGKTPLQLLEEKRWQEVADFVEDILTGSPG